jgi:hypothetical protein
MSLAPRGRDVHTPIKMGHGVLFGSVGVVVAMDVGIFRMHAHREHQCRRKIRTWARPAGGSRIKTTTVVRARERGLTGVNPPRTLSVKTGSARGSILAVITSEKEGYRE